MWKAQSYGSGFFFWGRDLLSAPTQDNSKALGQVENLAFLSINGAPLLVNNRVSPVWLRTKITSLKTGQ